MKLFIKVREDNGSGGFTGGQSDEAIRNAFAILENDFSPHNIFFNRSCAVIDVVVPSLEYNDWNLYCNLWSDPSYQYDDGIAIFLGPPNPYAGPIPGGGVTNGIPCNKIWVAGFWPAFGNAVESPVISVDVKAVEENELTPPSEG